MAATFRSAATANTGSTPAGSLVIGMPAGFAANDMLIAAMAVSGGSGETTTPPAGWTLLQSTIQSTNTRLSTYWRLATGAETGYTWTFDTTRQASGAIVAYSGVYGFAPMDYAATTNATPGTSLTPVGTQSSYTGVALTIFATNNTTAAANITPANTERVDITTTASNFINLEIQEQIKGFPVGGSATTASTSSQSVTFAQHTIFIGDDRPQLNILGIDELSAGSSTTGVTSFTAHSTFSANYPEEVILCIVGIGKSVQTVTSVTGLSLTWNFGGRANTVSGSNELWWAWSPNTFSRQAITVNFSGTVTGVNATVMGIRGADPNGPIGAVVSGTSSSAAPSINLTTTRSYSWVWGAANDPLGSHAVTTAAGQTNVRSLSDATNATTAWTQKVDALTALPGTVVTVSDTAPNTDSCNILAFEIVPARKPRQGFTGGVGFGIA